MNNKSLFSRIRKLVATERRIGVEILECLYEIERRKAYSELKYDGLFTYCIKELGFTDSQAYQRIQAMRALKELPELKTKIESGTLSVSSISKVQTHIKKERKAGKRIGVTQKLELFQLMENRTSKEVDSKLSEIRGEERKVKLIFELDEEAAELWKQVKDFAAHKTGSDDLANFKLLARAWLKQNHPEHQTNSHPSRKTRILPGKTKISQPRRAVPLLTQVETARKPTQPQLGLKSKEAPALSSRYIPVPLKREIWKRDQSKCTNCGSKHALEIDHIHPYGMGGKNELNNLRLLCRPCNQHKAIREYGIQEIEKFS